MKKIKTYTLGWDTNKKEGYISLTDDQNEKHQFSKIATQEFSMLLLMLHHDKLFLDNQNWLISGWDN